MAKVTEKQVIEAYVAGLDAVEYMCEAIKELTSDLRKLAECDVPQEALTPVLRYGIAPLMEAMGNSLSDRDAVTDEDVEKTDRAFKLVHRVLKDLP